MIQEEIGAYLGFPVPIQRQRGLWRSAHHARCTLTRCWRGRAIGGTPIGGVRDREAAMAAVFSGGGRHVLSHTETRERLSQSQPSEQQ